MAGPSPVDTARSLQAEWRRIIQDVRNVANHFGRIAADARTIGEIGTFGGGTAAQVAMVSSTLGALGLPISDITNMAARIRQTIATDPLGRAAATSLGIGQVLPRGFGSTNDVEILNQVIEGIQRATDVEEVRMAVIRLQEPELLRILRMSKEQVATAREIAALQQQVLGPETLNRFAQLLTLVQQFGQVMLLVGAHTLDFWLRQFNLPGVTGQGIMDALNRAMNQNTQAVQANTVMIGNLRSVFGGGPRARGAVPAGLRGEILRKALESDAVKLGAFNL